MKSVLIFDFDNEGDIQDFKLHCKAHEMHGRLDDVFNNIRNKLKHSDLTPNETKMLEEIKDLVAGYDR